MKRSSNMRMGQGLPLKSESPFERFAELAKKLFAVSKAEITDKENKAKKHLKGGKSHDDEKD